LQKFSQTKPGDPITTQFTLPKAFALSPEKFLTTASIIRSKNLVLLAAVLEFGPLFLAIDFSIFALWTVLC
jgi:hypothetical protein